LVHPWSSVSRKMKFGLEGEPDAALIASVASIRIPSVSHCSELEFGFIVVFGVG
jgi:hypothetical protein